MGIFPQMNNSGRKRDGSKHSGRPSSTQSAGGPYSLKIYKSLRPVLDRIRTPEPAPFVPDPFQLEALREIETLDVLVTAPTGAGKTYIAVEAIGKIFKKGGKAGTRRPSKRCQTQSIRNFETSSARKTSEYSRETGKKIPRRR